MMAGPAIFDEIRGGDLVRVKRMVSRNPAVLGQRDGSGLTPLLRALYEGKGEIVEAILAREPELDLFEAAAVGRADRVSTLVGRSRARARAYSEDGFTPLHLAAFFGQLEAARALLDLGADVHARSRNEKLPSATPLHSAAAGKHTDVAILLLERDAEVDAVQNGGWTALHAAAASGNLALCRALIARGAERGRMSDDRTRPLDFAIENRHPEVVELLRGGQGS
jgi:ankyrin repeat protein